MPARKPSRDRTPAARRAVAWALLASAAWTLPFAAAAANLGEPTWNVPGGDALRGAGWIAQLGCGGCHTVPGVRGAEGNVGPPLTRFGDRVYIAGMLRNRPAELVRWIRSPQSVVPGNVMPDMGITEPQARDIAAYLYTLR